MKPLDFHLLGCSVTDYHTGEEVGRIRLVVLDDEGQRVSRLGMERCDGPLFVPDMVTPPSRQVLFEGDPVLAVEGRVEDDYMVGQIATREVRSPLGEPVVAQGDPITPEVLCKARRLGLLHQLDAAFPLVQDG